MKSTQVRALRNSFVLLSAVIAASGCSVAEHKLAATDTGDLSNPSAERVSSLPHVEQCGAGALTKRGSELIEREPYLQNMTSDAATILLTLSSDEDLAATLDVSLPDGSPVTSVSLERDQSDETGQQWRARLTDLEPNQVYCYSLSDLVKPAGFRTAPEAGSGELVRFVVFGDSGGSNGDQDAVRDQIGTVPMDLIIHTGDLAYGDGKLSQLEGTFFDVYADLLRSVPFFPNSGNHDYKTQAAAPYRQVFELPGNGSADTHERWYSFDWGDVHFVALDTERVGDQQIDWLEKDLASNSLTWTVAYLHRPPYSSGFHGSSTGVRRAFSPLFEEYGVQVVFAGHDHDYERTKPIGGVTYVVTGGGGLSTRSVGRSSYTAFSEDALHFVFAEVKESAMVLHAVDGVGREFDSVLIKPFDNG